MKQRLKVTKETSTGLNVQFEDTKTKETLNRTQVIERIDNGKYSGYDHYLRQGKKVIRSKPDGNTKNNLG